MKTWVELYKGHTQIRDAGKGKAWSNALRTRLRDFAAAGYCEPGISSRFSNKRREQLETWSISGDRSLRNIGGSTNVELTLLVLCNAKTGRIHQVTASVEGTRDDGSTWVVAVHLPDDRDRGADRQGSGACGHAALHCHIGPTYDAKPKLRVPLPALEVVDILDWLFSQIAADNAFERAPWDDVQRAIEK